MEADSRLLNKYAYDFLVPTSSMGDDEAFKKASVIAYGDMARHTMRIAATSKEKNELKNAVTSLLMKRIETLNKQFQAAKYNNWHEETCAEIIECYETRGFNISYGQAQKWVNMLIKYLYVYNIKKYTSFFNNKELICALHVPIDSKIIDIAYSQFGVKKPKCAWSKLDKTAYIAYQTELRKAIISKESKCVPFYWELVNWKQ